MREFRYVSRIDGKTTSWGIVPVNGNVTGARHLAKRILETDSLDLEIRYVAPEQNDPSINS